MAAITGMLGRLFYVGLLLTNAMAVLSEDRFLARIGWTSSPQQNAANQGYNQGYGSTGYEQAPQDIGVKVKIIDLISAVRTLMRIPLIALNIIFIVWEFLSV